MEDEAPSYRSVAELAGRFKVSAPPQKNEADKPVRRRPPRTLQLPKGNIDEQEDPAGVTSPQPPKAKRNSALIEKLQANLTLSPMGPPLKSPGLRVLPLGFTPPSPGSPRVTTPTSSSSGTPTSPVSASATEGPASFEAPPSSVEGNILPSINKSRARVSIRRRPPSRKHRKSSSGDDVGGDMVGVSSRRKAGGGEEEEGEDVFQKESQTEASSPPERDETHEGVKSRCSCDEEEGDASSSHVREDEEGDASSSHVREDEEGDASSSHVREDEEGDASSSHVREDEEGDASSSHVREDEEDPTQFDKQKDSADEGMKDEEEKEKNQPSS